MRKSLVALLATGLLLLGVTPVWAAGQAMAAAVPAQQDEVVQVVVPEGEELSDRSLGKARGEFEVAPWLAGAAWGAAVGAGTQMVANSLQGEPLFKNVGRAAVIGAVSGAGTVTKSVIVVKKYASGLVEAGAKTVIDW